MRFSVKSADTVHGFAVYHPDGENSIHHHADTRCRTILSHSYVYRAGKIQGSVPGILWYRTSRDAGRVDRHSSPASEGALRRGIHHVKCQPPPFNAFLYSTRCSDVDETTGLEEINAWPALMVMTSFVWLAVAGLLGLVMPLTQIAGAAKQSVLHRHDRTRRSPCVSVSVSTHGGCESAQSRKLRGQARHRNTQRVDLLVHEHRRDPLDRRHTPRAQDQLCRDVSAPHRGCGNLANGA